MCSSDLGVDRVELYTYDYAKGYSKDDLQVIKPFQETFQAVAALGISINAGHDLNAQNLHYFLQAMPGCKEVSIGHAFVCDCLAKGLPQTMVDYLACLPLSKEASK